MTHGIKESAMKRIKRIAHNRFIRMNVNEYILLSAQESLGIAMDNNGCLALVEWLGHSDGMDILFVHKFLPHFEVTDFWFELADFLMVKCQGTIARLGDAAFTLVYGRISALALAV
jgi:hypothetical protein